MRGVGGREQHCNIAVFSEGKVGWVPRRLVGVHAHSHGEEGHGLRLVQGYSGEGEASASAAPLVRVCVHGRAQTSG